MQSQRFPYRIHLAGGEAVVTMDCGEGVYRARSIPIWFLRCMADLCRTCARTLDRHRDEQRHADDLPAFPNCKPLTGIPLGPCTARVVASKTVDGKVEISVAFYDIGDDAAPALLLTEEQIPEFVRTVAELLNGRWR